MSKWVYSPVQEYKVATETWGVLSYHSPPYCLETLSLTEMEVHNLAEAAWPVSSSVLAVSGPPVLSTERLPCSRLFIECHPCWDSRHSTQWAVALVT